MAQARRRVKECCGLVFAGGEARIEFKSSKMRSILTVIAAAAVSASVAAQIGSSEDLARLERAAASKSTDPRVWYALGQAYNAIKQEALQTFDETPEHAPWRDLLAADALLPRRCRCCSGRSNAMPMMLPLASRSHARICSRETSLRAHACGFRLGVLKGSHRRRQQRNSYDHAEDAGWSAHRSALISTVRDRYVARISLRLPTES
jgi:hypothetical protein